MRGSACALSLDTRGPPARAGAPAIPRSVPLSKPVAITVILTSFWRCGSITAPKMMLASASAARETMSAASWISVSVRSLPPVMLNSTPRAPSIEMSSSGLAIAILAASTAR